MITRMAARLRRSEEGFTLIELLVVVAIIALLATFAVPKLFDAINKSKKAPGDSDMNTLSSAFERHYMDNTAYPIDNTTTSGNEVETALKNGYVKSNTTFINGFRRGYVYITDTTGSYYIMVDPQNNSGALTVVCGTDPSATNNWTSTAVTAGNNFVVSVQTGPTSAQMNQGCRVTSTTAGFDAAKTSIITN